MKKNQRQLKRHQKKLRDIKTNKLLTMAQACYTRQELERANAIYQQVLEHDSQNVAALHGLGRIALDVGMLDTAADLLNAALCVDKDNIAVKKSLALLFTRQDRIDYAIKLYVSMLHHDDTNAATHGELARLYLLSGEMDAALNHFRKAYDIDPSNPKHLHGLIQLDRQAITPDVLRTIEAQLEKPDIPLSERSSFYYALGSIHDHAGRYEEAFANYTVANLAKPMKYDHAQFTAFVSEIISTFTPKLFAQYEHAGNDTGRPVFIVGMPRSGTTLVEQILASHPEIHAAGELNHIEKLAASMSANTGHDLSYPKTLNQFNKADIQSIADTQEKLINALAVNNASRVTDKMPVNFLHLGLIALLFPKAHIIHCRRNPLDTCLSCYFQNFSGNHAYASDLTNLGHYYREYERLMLHWSSVLPVKIHHVSYERLVSEPKISSRKMLGYLDLEWHEACLHFHRTQRNIHTASVVQVRQPLYSTSVGRWRHYDKYIHSLKKALCIGDEAWGNDDETVIPTREAAQFKHHQSAVSNSRL
ncbi:MAG: sulfotransferase [Gammaproteobacteria bacterium]|jgi:tetratricopeptide (TPR) repeat protein